MAGETYEIYFRDVLDCLRSLFDDPEFVPHLVFLPEHHYAEPDHTTRLFYDMHTGRWWWGVQVLQSFISSNFTYQIIQKAALNDDVILASVPQLQGISEGWRHQWGTYMEIKKHFETLLMASKTALSPAKDSTSQFNAIAVS